MADSKRRTLVLFQPKDECVIMPLGLLHVGSGFRELRVEIVDGRLELAPEARVVELVREAVCLGVSVPSGRPVAEAFRVTRAARSVRPDLFVVWGGSHASARPDQCLVPGGADACISGAGEGPLRGIVDALLRGTQLGSIPGVSRREGDALVNVAPDPSPSLESHPPVDYSLLDLDRHFRLRGNRGIDYCSSRWVGGVWQGLGAERVACEVAGLTKRFRLSEVRMADAEFFGDVPRALAIARGLVVAGVRLRWFARSSARGLLSLEASEWDLLRASGLARVSVPVPAEVGDVPTLGSDERLALAKLLRRAGLGATFTYLIGRPEEDPTLVARVFDEARSIRQTHGGFETTMRYWAPWPSENLSPVPGLTEPIDEAGWATSALGDGPGPWVPPRTRDLVARREFYLRRAFERPSRGVAKRVVHWSAGARLKTGFYRMDLDRRIVELSRRLRGGARSIEPRCDE
jgi:anaerobic magnesium-protoporphyrin IX monomethyl ester cyclase